MKLSTICKLAFRDNRLWGLEVQVLQGDQEIEIESLTLKDGKFLLGISARVSRDITLDEVKAALDTTHAQDN